MHIIWKLSIYLPRRCIDVPRTETDDNNSKVCHAIAAFSENGMNVSFLAILLHVGAIFWHFNPSMGDNTESETFSSLSAASSIATSILERCTYKVKSQ